MFSLEIREQLHIRAVDYTGRQRSIIHGPFLSDELDRGLRRALLFTIAFYF
jgi:hypothetical protein